MGYSEAFDYRHPADIFREHAHLSGYENNHQRLFNISGLANITNQEYDALKPVQWPVITHPQTAEYDAIANRPFSDGRFSSADKKAHFIAVKAQLPQSLINQQYPFKLLVWRLLYLGIEKIIGDISQTSLTPGICSRRRVNR